MELIKPDFGLFFWMIIVFGILFFIVAKFAFPVIGKTLKKREQKIAESLEQAERIHEEMQNIQAKNEEILKKAKEEREVMLNEARISRDKIIEEAKTKAKEETDRLVDAAKETIENERKAAMTDIKNEIATISIKVAEKILERELSSDEAQIKYINEIIKETDNQ